MALPVAVCACAARLRGRVRARPAARAHAPSCASKSPPRGAGGPGGALLSIRDPPGTSNNRRVGALWATGAPRAGWGMGPPPGRAAGGQPVSGCERAAGAGGGAVTRLSDGARRGMTGPRTPGASKSCASKAERKKGSDPRFRGPRACMAAPGRPVAEPGREGWSDLRFLRPAAAFPGPAPGRSVAELQLVAPPPASGCAR